MIDDEFLQDSIRFVPSKAAATSVGLPPDYISRLCRDGLVMATRRNGQWYVNEEALAKYLAIQTLEREVNKPLH